MNYKRSLYLFYGGMAVALVIMLAGCSREIDWLFWTGFVVMGCAVFQTAIFYRCPHCNGWLNVRGPRPKYCPHCGEEME